MALVDSLDSIVMLYAYAGAAERKKRFTLIEKLEIAEGPISANKSKDNAELKPVPDNHVPNAPASESRREEEGNKIQITSSNDYKPDEQSLPLGSHLESEKQRRIVQLKQYTTSTLGILLTLMSIVIAFTYVRHRLPRGGICSYA